MSIRIFNENDKKKWNVAIQIDSQFDTWYSYRFKKFYCGEVHKGDEVKCLCSFETQQDYVSHMLGAHGKAYKNPDFVLPILPKQYIIANDELYIKDDDLD